jgi:hypothetical protein
MEYKGWSLYDNVTLVIRKEKTLDNTYRQAYVVDPKNKSQLKSAIKWGTLESLKVDENGEVLRDENGVAIYNVVEPEVITVENKGFKLSLLNSAENSYRGGKLSFWNCLIKGDNIPDCAIGISSDILLNILVQNKFNYGSCDKELMFARCNGGLGMLNDNMVEYKDALKDMESKAISNSHKTTKWQTGHNYITLTTDSTYIGTVVMPFDIKIRKDHKSYWYNDSVEITIELHENKENTKYLIINTDALKLNNIRTSKELIDFYKKEVEFSFYELRYRLPNAQLLDKLPSRTMGEYTIPIDDTVIKMFNDLFEHEKEKVLDLVQDKDKLKRMLNIVNGDVKVNIINK